MKKLLLLATMIALTIPMMAQDNIIYTTIPTTFDLKDRIFLSNHSPYTILHAVIAKNDKPLEKIGECQILGPNASVQIVDYKHSGLKNFIGKELAIKIKGVKQVLTRTSRLNVGNGVIGNIVSDIFGNVLSTTEVDPELVNNLDSTKITYDFRVTLSEENHDLYINVYENTSTNDIMNF